MYSSKHSSYFYFLLPAICDQTFLHHNQIAHIAFWTLWILVLLSIVKCDPYLYSVSIIMLLLIKSRRNQWVIDTPFNTERLPVFKLIYNPLPLPNDWAIKRLTWWSNDRLRSIPMYQLHITPTSTNSETHKNQHIYLQSLFCRQLA